MDPNAACNAPLHAGMTQQERRRDRTACCYDLPRHCLPPNAGRALRVDGELAFAGSEPRADWDGGDPPAKADDVINADPEAAGLPRVEHLDAAQREQRAEQWCKMAAFEHASVASFGRVSLQLLALGAPPELLEQTHEAALDEIRHARLAYSLSSAFSARAEGPGKLPAAVIKLPETDIVSFAKETFLDACVEETVGAVAARSAAATESDPVVRSVLLRIAEDEERHAELAWRTLAWAVGVGGQPVLAALGQTLDQLEKGAPTDETRAQVLELLVQPCARALLENPREA